MAENGYGPVGHVGRIPNYGIKSQPMANVEPPACIQNAMMTKDKKPFTYTPGGLDLSQCKTPSMARRMARQRSLEEQEQAHAPQHQGNGGVGFHQPHGGPAPPPPPAPQVPAPPPPPALVIEVSKAKSPKPMAPGERPEIVIPENPIGMLRKTNSPYHWEAEKAELEKLGAVPKFVEKTPSPKTVQMPPSTFSQQPPQTYVPQQNNFQRNNYQNAPESPIHKPAPQYGNQQVGSPKSDRHTTRDALQRQDSQFNKSPQPFSGLSPISNVSNFSPSPNNNWRQPERRDSPLNNVNSSAQQFNRGPMSPNFQPSSQPNYQNQNLPESVTSYNTLPRAAGQRNQDVLPNNNNYNNALYNNTANRPQTQPLRVDQTNQAPWRNNAQHNQPPVQETPNIYHNNKPANVQQAYSPPWNANNNNQIENTYVPPWNRDIKPDVNQHVAFPPNQQTQNHVNQPRQHQQQNQFANQQQTQHFGQARSQPQQVPHQGAQDYNRSQQQNQYGIQQNNTWRNQEANRGAALSPTFGRAPQEDPRYQSSITIPVIPRKPISQPENNNVPQREIVYVNQEPIFYCPPDNGSPKTIPAWVKTQKEKTKTPPPEWIQKPLERKSAPRELVTPPRDQANQEPEWIKKSQEMQRNVREVLSPPRYEQPQPTWSTRPSENRKSIPKDNVPQNNQGSRIIPIHMENASNQNRQHQPQLRVSIDPNQHQPQAPFSPPTQRIMRVLSPQLVRLDDGPNAHDLPSLNRNFQPNTENQAKTRIIPIQIEGGSNGANKRVHYHKFTQEGPPPRQSRAFRVFQVITGTQGQDYQSMEKAHGFSDL